MEKEKKITNTHDWIKTEAIQGCRKKLFCGGILLASKWDVAQAENYQLKICKFQFTFEFTFLCSLNYSQATGQFREKLALVQYAMLPLKEENGVWARDCLVVFSGRFTDPNLC